MEKSLTISLYDSGMTSYHRVGLAGLYLSLKQLEREGRELEDGSWVLDETSVTLKWQGKALPFFDALLKFSFGVDKNGLVDFAAHRGCRTGDTERILIHQSLLGTFLNHNQYPVPRIHSGFKSTLSTISRLSPRLRPPDLSVSIPLLDSVEKTRWANSP